MRWCAHCELAARGRVRCAWCRRVRVRWTPGYWWFSLRLWARERRQAARWWLALHLPREVALLAFVRVHATQDSPGPEFVAAYKAFERGEGR